MSISSRGPLNLNKEDQALGREQGLMAVLCSVEQKSRRM